MERFTSRWCSQLMGRPAHTELGRQGSLGIRWHHAMERRTQRKQPDVEQEQAVMARQQRHHQ